MSNTIKVTVEYETPKTTKFEALMKELEVAKKIADETVSYYKPLADCAEEAKFEAIMEQLEIIKQYAKQISDFTGQAVFIEEWFGSKFQVIYRPQENRFRFEIRYGGQPFDKHEVLVKRKGINIITNWENNRHFEILEQNACKQLQELIKKENSRGQKQIDRLNAIQK